MSLRDIVRRSRSYRRFYENERVEEKTLRELVDLARMSPSASNLQPLKYMLSFEASRNELIFPTLEWAGYLKDWPGPEKGERPSAYIIILGDRDIGKRVYFYYDSGIACQSILLGATEKGLGGCIIGMVNRELLRKNLNISSKYEILVVVALGKPKEKVVLEEAKGDIKYYRDSSNTHHVPKRPLEEIIIS